MSGLDEHEGIVDVDVVPPRAAELCRPAVESFRTYLNDQQHLTEVTLTFTDGQKLRVERDRVRFGAKGAWVDLSEWLLPNQSASQTERPGANEEAQHG